jgi:hypothetical protein
VCLLQEFLLVELFTLTEQTAFWPLSSRKAIDLGLEYELKDLMTELLSGWLGYSWTMVQPQFAIMVCHSSLGDPVAVMTSFVQLYWACIPQDSVGQSSTCDETGLRSNFQGKVPALTRQAFVSHSDRVERILFDWLFRVQLSWSAVIIQILLYYYPFS